MRDRAVLSTVFLSGLIARPKDSPIKFSLPEEKWTQEEVIEHLRMNLGLRIQIGHWDWEEEDDS